VSCWTYIYTSGVFGVSGGAFGPSDNSFGLSVGAFGPSDKSFGAKKPPFFAIFDGFLSFATFSSPKED
jgi:hypothetical protein